MQLHFYWNNLGTLPTYNEGEVNRTACIVGLYGNCSKTLNIRVKNCGKYNVYHLVPVPQTSTGYCIGFIESFFILYWLCILQRKIYKEQILFTKQMHVISECVDFLNILQICLFLFCFFLQISWILLNYNILITMKFFSALVITMFLMFCHKGYILTWYISLMILLWLQEKTHIVPLGNRRFRV